MPPSMATEFLCRIADILNEYLDGLNEDLIKDNFVIVYEVLPVIASPTHYLFELHGGIMFLACRQVEMPPLMAIEFRRKVADVSNEYLGSFYEDVIISNEYLGGFNEDMIKDNFVIVYLSYILFPSRLMIANYSF
ncbi:hypothetical protein MKW98_027382 [Papaver atlanticum]|uniref:Uncharacterized protein n=1 Tax=Papaver atlanticum TaxID=357466 RepID=A0AAD4TH29_9MAGN|nr:hypothetical protein MKW98_027382 [Papaver atlanticum]